MRSPADLPLGEAGRYRPRRQIGEDPIGALWQADDTAMNALVTLRVFRDELGAHEQFVQALAVELSRIFRRLQHPNIADVISYADGLEWPTRFFVMRGLDGESLARHLSKASLDPYQAKRIASQVQKALIAAHQSGFVHGGLTAHSIVLTSGGDIKVVDFGVPTALREVVRLGSGALRDDAMGSPAVTRTDDARDLELLLTRMTSPATATQEDELGRLVDSVVSARPKTPLAVVRPPAEPPPRPALGPRRQRPFAGRPLGRTLMGVGGSLVRPLVVASRAIVRAPVAAAGRLGRGAGAIARLVGSAGRSVSSAVTSTGRSVGSAVTSAAGAFTRAIRSAPRRGRVPLLAAAVAVMGFAAVTFAIITTHPSPRLGEKPPPVVRAATPSPTLGSGTGSPTGRPNPTSTPSSIAQAPAVAVPNVTGLPALEAASMLEAAGLVVVDSKPTTGSPGDVVRTDPAVGTAVERGAGVVLYVGTSSDRLNRT
jgi:tRNA A-37 threonylcarbamoyl transferase component Bud32